ncbi:MAG: hypothetical protein QNI89_18140, partial [Desulfobacterales bacterium]|nr:hypothetical protein [Desulfobacterales bacterium]
QITSVVAPDGTLLVHNKIWRTPAGLENSGEEGQRSIDMAPAAPHTTDRKARECTSCHASAKALGYGTHDGRYLQGYNQGVYVDIMDNQGKLLTKTAQYQISPVPELSMDLDNVIDREDLQLQTVGHHWPLDGPLPAEVRANMERTGVCLSCHQVIPDGAFVYQIISKVGETLGMVPENDAEHRRLIGRAMFVAANVEIFGIPIAILVIIVFVVLLRRKKAS